MEQDGLRTKSFRYEDYNTRRVFLRSYPLNFGDESESEESRAEIPQKSKGTARKHNKHESAAYVVNRPTGKKPIKKMILAFVQWGEERVVVFRRFKHKVTIYVVSCVPMTLKAPTGLISIK